MHPKYPNIAVEIKKAQNNSIAESERLAHEALEQIEEKDYRRGLRGRTLMYGIAVRGKEAKALLEETGICGSASAIRARQIGYIFQHITDSIQS